MKLPARSLAIAATLSASLAHATLITHEDFDYSTGSLDGLNGGTGWGGAWDSQEDNSNYEIETGSPLSFGSLLTSGNYANGGGSFQNSGRRLDTGFLSGWDAAGRVSDPFSAGTGLANIDQGTVWASMLVRVNATITSWDNARIFFHSNNIPWQPGANAENDGLQFRLNGGSSTWGISEGQSGGTTSTGITATVGSDYLFVAKFELSLTAGANNAYVWVFDDPFSVTLGGPDLSTGTAHASITGRNTTDLRFKSIGLYLDNANDRVSIDEIRLGTTFASVTPIPEPATAAMLLGGAAVLVLRRRVRA